LKPEIYIYFQLYRCSNAKRCDQGLSVRPSESPVERSQSSLLKSTTAVMFAVVCLFGICSSPLVITEIVTKTYSEIYFTDTSGFRNIADDTSHLFRFQLATYALKALNCSLNFIVFNLIGRRFRTAMFQMFGAWRNWSYGQCQNLKLWISSKTEMVSVSADASLKA